MTIYIDPPNAPGHGRLWSHVSSDTSYAELHAFAEQVGIPERGFDRDHYDVPSEMYDACVAAGAVPISSRDLAKLLKAAGLRRRKTEVLRVRRPGRTLLEPAFVRPGDRVAVVFPAGPVAADRLAPGLAALAGWGLDVEVWEHGDDELPWLAGPDRARADAVTQAWLDPTFRAVWCARGGFGTQRILDLIDWTALRSADPAWLVGMSDITALHQGFQAQLGVATVHGPGVAELGETDDATRERVRRVVFGEPLDPLSGVSVRGGRAQGPLVGGNLTLLAANVGTPIQRPAAGGIALLEDVNEHPYRLDRALTQLLRSGWFHDVQGVAWGQFSACGEPDLVRELLDRRLGPLGVPLVGELPLGHATPNQSVVLGRAVTLDGDAGTLTQSPP